MFDDRACIARPTRNPTSNIPTTAATVPLTIDYWRQQGKVKRGDRILSSVFGSGFTWGAAIFTL